MERMQLFRFVQTTVSSDYSVQWEWNNKVRRSEHQSPKITAVLDRYSAYSPLGGLSGLDIFKNPTVIRIADRHNVSAAQVALKWLVQRNITIVTAADNSEYISEDMDLFSWGELSAEEMATLAAV